MNTLKLPNTFLIGAQKAATSSLYSWLDQHPDICGPLSVKDLAFFTRDEFFNKGLEHLSGFYEEIYKEEKILLQGSVHYIFFEKALQRIHDFNPEAKFILILRNPVERAISAYKYAIKFNYENLQIREAFTKEDERLNGNDIRVLSELTYKHHGLYYKQIMNFLKYFKEEQLKVVLFEDVSNHPQKVVKDVFNFLGLENDFLPKFKILNNTGDVKNKTLQKIVFGDGKIRNLIVKKGAKYLISEKLKAKLRWKLIHFNTKEKKSEYLDIIDNDLRTELNEFFREDIELLEKYLSRNLDDWKL